MKTRLTTLPLLVFALLLTLVVPATAAPAPNKNLCKGAEYSLETTVDGEKGETTTLTETVVLSWRVLFAGADDYFDGQTFKNQGQCIAHVNQGNALYFSPCAVLADQAGDGKLYDAQCMENTTSQWLLSTAGQ